MSSEFCETWMTVEYFRFFLDYWKTLLFNMVSFHMWLNCFHLTFISIKLNYSFQIVTSVKKASFFLTNFFLHEICMWYQIHAKNYCLDFLIKKFALIKPNLILLNNNYKVKLHSYQISYAMIVLPSSQRSTFLAKKNNCQRHLQRKYGEFELVHAHQLIWPKQFLHIFLKLIYVLGTTSLIKL